MTDNERRAHDIADLANGCCNRRDGWRAHVYDCALEHLDEANSGEVGVNGILIGLLISVFLWSGAIAAYMAWVRW